MTRANMSHRTRKYGDAETPGSEDAARLVLRDRTLPSTPAFLIPRAMSAWSVWSENHLFG
jgi:hypothetical protein